MSPTKKPTETVRPVSNEMEPGYREAIALLVGLLLGLTILQAWRNPTIPLLSPLKAGLGIFLPLALAFALGLAFPRNLWVRFLGGTPFAITSITLTSLAALCGTLVLQNPSPEEAIKLGAAFQIFQRLGLTDLYHTPWFGALVITLVLCLALAAGRRSRTLDMTAFAFLLTHGGLALTLAGGLYGNLTAQVGQIAIEEGGGSHLVRLEHGGFAQLPSALRLEHFHVDPFPLEVSLAERNGEDLNPKGSGRALPSLEVGRTVKLGNWTLRCEEAYPSAEPEIKLIPDPAGAPSMELKLRAHGGTVSFPVSPLLGPRELPGNTSASLMEVAEGRMEEALRDAPKIWKSEGPGILYLSDGKTLACLVRNVDGSQREIRGADAMKPIRLASMELEAGPISRARVDGFWKAAEGIRPRPTGAARVVATKGELVRSGWIASGPEGSDTLPLEGELVLMVLPPQPKAFRSELVLDGKPATLRMNAPLVFYGWTLSQSGYEATLSGTTMSVIKAVKDPSTPVVFTGLGMLLVGVLAALWVLPANLRRSA